MLQRLYLGSLLLLTLFLIACGGAPASPEPMAPMPTSTAAPPTPSLAPPTATPPPSATALGPVPDTEAELAAWLTAAWEMGLAVNEIQPLLQETEWRVSQDGLQLVDLTGDGRDEWLVTLCSQREADGACLLTFAEQVMGDLWVVGDGGVLHRVSEHTDLAWRSAPRLLATGDFSGDGRADALTVTTLCGAHTCYDLYHILSAHHGPVENLVHFWSPDLEQWLAGVEMSYSDWEVRDATGDGRDDLVLAGGYVGSAGAGIQRGRTEIWSWDGEAVSLADREWEATAYRFHWLYNANEAFDAGEDEVARQRYERVIHDEALEDVAWAEPAAAIRDHSRQFAAFRLALLALRQNERAEAGAWRDWLQAEYPGAPLTQAAQQLLDAVAAGQTPPQACAAVTAFLSSVENPTGPLLYMGYANPVLDAEAVCPW
jgi:hypothetical protein